MTTNDLLNNVRQLQLTGTDTDEIKRLLISTYSESDIDQAIFELKDMQAKHEPLEFSEDAPKKVGFYPFVLIAMGILALNDALSDMFGTSDNWDGLFAIMVGIFVMPVFSLINILLLWSKKYNSTAKLLLIAGLVLYLVVIIALVINDGPPSG